MPGLSRNEFIANPWEPSAAGCPPVDRQQDVSASVRGGAPQCHQFEPLQLWWVIARHAVVSFPIRPWHRGQSHGRRQLRGRWTCNINDLQKQLYQVHQLIGRHTCVTEELHERAGPGMNRLCPGKREA